MPTLSTRVSDGEFKAITEFANACGLSISDLMKNVLISKICWLWLGHKEDKYFEDLYNAEEKNECNTDEEMAEFVNKFRKFVGIRPLKVGDF